MKRDRRCEHNPKQPISIQEYPQEQQRNLPCTSSPRLLVFQSEGSVDEDHAAVTDLLTPLISSSLSSNTFARDSPP